MKPPRAVSRPASRPASRRGAALVIVLVTLAVVAAICGTLLSTAISRQRVIRRHATQAQSLWLAEAGLDRAAARLADDPGYDGEVWELPAEDLDGAPARVTIVVTRPDDGAAATAVRVEADYPADAVRRVRSVKTVVLPPIAQRGAP